MHEGRIREGIPWAMVLGECLFGKYRITHIMKENEDVSVYRGEHQILKTQWMIKQLHHISETTDREVDMLRNLRHKGIPLMVDAAMTGDDEMTFVREYIEGDTLHERVQRDGFFSEADAINYGLQICGVLRYLHESFERPIIHRDIKPANIVLTQSGTCYLIDFGIARQYKTDQGKDTSYLGTKGFAAPEQFGLSQSSETTDIFGLGVTLYYLVTGRDLSVPPCRYESIRSMQGKVPFSKAFDAVLEKACQLDRHKRFESAEAFEKALAQILGRQVQENPVQRLNRTAIPCIVFTGLKRGAGTTLAMMLYGYAARAHGLKVLFVDLSESKALANLEYTSKGVRRDGIVYYDNMPILTERDEGRVWNDLLREQMNTYDYIIVDMGVKSALRLSGLTFQTCYMVAGMREWEMDMFEEDMLSPQLRERMDENGESEFVYLVNSGEEIYNELKETMPMLEFERIPKIPDCFDAMSDRDWDLIRKWFRKKEGQTCLLEKEPVQGFFKGSLLKSKLFDKIRF